LSVVRDQLSSFHTGTFGNVIRLLVPLLITDEPFEEGWGGLESAIESVGGTQAPAATI